jgi:two-component system sensor histidine kinase CreC
VSRRNRIFLGILCLFAVVVGLLLYRVASDLDSRYRESTEESLVDTSHLLAAFIETDIQEQRIDAQRLQAALGNAYRQRFEAHIFDLVKRRVDLHIYLTDVNGTVLFDTEGQAVGKNFKKWLDVSSTLAGKYGARTTQTDPNRPETAVMYVAAPIRDGQHIVGVVSVGKPVASQYELVATARQKLFYVGLITVTAFILLLVVLSIWLVRPFGLTSDLLRIVHQEGLRHPVRLLHRLSAVTKTAFGDMRDALAGRSHTEEYVEVLTHELKSPLTAIRAAAELLGEPMPEEKRRHFAANIDQQAKRLQDLADRLLELASLEKRRTLENIQSISICDLVQQVEAAVGPSAQRKKITLKMDADTNARVEGDPFLLHQALVNLAANAIDFSPPDGVIEINARLVERRIELTVRDHGAGVPDYALDRAFEKFYSLRWPDSGHKGTGLGLAFVREIAHLHNGKAWLANHPDGGAIAVLSLPSAPASK